MAPASQGRCRGSEHTDVSGCTAAGDAIGPGFSRPNVLIVVTDDQHVG